MNGEVVYGPFMKLPSPEIVEIAGHAGFDFAILDTEHGPLTAESIQSLVRAAEVGGITPIVRVYENDSALIARSLDVGARGILAPHISSKQEAVALARAARFAPDGDRGICRFVRSAGFSAMDKYSYFAQANQDILVAAIVEGREGLADLDEILAVSGLDVIFIGPYDLSQSLGFPGEVEHSAVVDQVQRAVDKAVSLGRAVGVFVEDQAGAKRWAGCGVQFIAFSVDVGIVYAAMRQIVAMLRESIPGGE